MKKWLSLLVVVLLLFFVAVPGAMGVIAEKRIKKLISNWPAGSPFSAQVVDYKRGWFTSSMKLVVALKTALHNQPLNIQINESVVHGPLILDFSNHFVGFGQAYATGELTVPADQQAFFKQYIDQTNLLKNSIFLALFGDVEVGFDIPELSVTDPATPDMRLTLEGLATRATVSPSVSHIMSHSAIQEINWQHADRMITLENISGNSNLKRTEQGLWLGDIKLSLDSLVVNAAKQTIFSISKAEYASSSKESDGLVSGKNDFNFDKLVIKDVSYGPAKLGVNITNINAAPLAQLKRLTQSMQTQSNVAVVQQGDMRKQKLIFKIISRGMQLTVSPLTMETPNGQIAGQLSIVMPNLLDDADGREVKNPHITIPALLGGIKADIKLTVPKVIALNNLQNSILSNMQALSNALASDPSNNQALQTAAQQRAAAQLQGWVAAGLITVNGDNYEFSANLEQGKFLINGKSVFNPALAAGASMMAAPVNAAVSPAVPAAPAAPSVVAPVPAGSVDTSAPVADSAVAPVVDNAAPVSSSTADTMGSAPQTASASTTDTTGSATQTAPASTVEMTQPVPATSMTPVSANDAAVPTPVAQPSAPAIAK